MTQLEDIPELKLINCINTIHSSSDLRANQEALKLLRSKATHHDTEGKTKLSIIYSEDHPLIKKDDIESNIWSRSVFDKQLSNALNFCSDILTLSGELSMINIIRSNEQKTEKDMNPELCYLSGLLYTKGIGFEQDLHRGIPLLKVAATRTDQADAACELGRIYGDRYKYSLLDAPESIHWFERAFECGSNQAIVDLAYAFFEGSDKIAKDDTRAFRYANDGALLNDKYCQYIVGHLYLKGKGIKENVHEAIKWLDASAKQGFSVALEEETALFMYGHSDMKPDYHRAFQCCTQPIANTIPYCQARLGDMYRNGWGVQQNYQKAFKHYQNAASQSETPHPYAQHIIGEMFLHGEGVPKDLAVAKEWFQIAATQGYEPSQTKITQIAHLESSAVIQQEKVPEHQEKRSRWSLGFFNSKKK